MLVRAMARVRTVDRQRELGADAFEFWEFSRRFDSVRLEIAAQLELGLTDLQALHVVDTRPRCTPGELARALDLTVSGTSSVIDRLVSRLMVVRQRHPVDRRSLQLEVTRTGRNAVEWSTDMLADGIDDIVQTLAPIAVSAPVTAATKAGDELADGVASPRLTRSAS